MKIVVIDGQGGKIGKSVVERLKPHGFDNIFALGTNSIATAVMLKAGAHFGATGENPVLVNCRDADIIIGPIGIVIADALFGEVTPAMAAAVAQSRAKRILLPVSKCNSLIAGTQQLSISEIVDCAVALVLQTAAGTAPLEQ